MSPDAAGTVVFVNECATMLLSARDVIVEAMSAAAEASTIATGRTKRSPGMIDLEAGNAATVRRLRGMRQ
jgi:hypothetical protein